MTPDSAPTINAALMAGNRRPLAGYRAQHFLWECSEGVARITLNRPERKNPLSFESYAELRDLFIALRHAHDVRSIVIAGAGDNFCSGGDVHEIIGPLINLPAPELLMFTRMTGDLVKAMRHCPQPIVAAVDGVCAGAGAILAMASDLRYGTARSKTAFLFARVGLAGCDMGACAMLPRIVGQGRAAEWIYSGRTLGLLQPRRRARRADRRSHGLRAPAGRRAGVRALVDEVDAASGVGDGHRHRDRGRGPGAGAVHADRGLRPRVSRVRRQDQAGVRGPLT